MKRRTILGAALAASLLCGHAAPAADVPAVQWQAENHSTADGQDIQYTPVNRKKYQIIVTVLTKANCGMTLDQFRDRSNSAAPQIYPGFRKISEGIVATRGGLQRDDLRGRFTLGKFTNRVHQVLFVQGGTSYLITAVYPDSRAAQSESLFESVLIRMGVR